MELEKLLVNDRVTASCQTNWSRSQVCYDGDDNENVKRAIGKQGSQIRQIWRILRQNCSDDSTEVTEGVTSTPEIFGNKQ